MTETDDQTRLETSRAVNALLKKQLANSTNLIESLVAKRIEDAAIAAGAKPKAVRDIVERGATIFQVVENGSAIEPRDANDLLIFGKGSATPIGIEGWAESLKIDAPHLFKTKEGPGPRGTSDLNQQLAEAIKNKDMPLQIRLKRLIAEAQQKA